MKCFCNAERVLRESQDSCYLSPEGKRWTTPKVGPFNKGTFHLVTNLGWDIVPIYVEIPARINPGVGFRTRPGDVHVYAHPPISTKDWTLEDVIANKERIRDLYLAFPEGWNTRKERAA